jgi:Ca2+-binding RTX toxin-like protein
VGAGHDTITGGGGYDLLRFDYGAAGSGVNVKAGADGGWSSGLATITASGVEAAEITGSRFGDTLAGGGTDDLVRGGAGADRLIGGAGRNELLAGEGDDMLGGDAVRQVSHFDGGGGADTLLIALSPDRSAADLTAGTIRGGLYDGSSITGVEHLTASGAAGPVTFIGDAAANRLIGGRGHDGLEGGGGGDTLTGGAGNDTLAGGDGADRLSGGLGADVFRFRPGEVAGDRIVDFMGAGALTGDSLVFEGFGPEATLASLGGGRWEIRYLHDGAEASEAFQLNTATLHASDFLFS